MKLFLMVSIVFVVASCAYAISPFEAAAHVGEVAVVEGNFACLDFTDKSIKFGLLDGRKQVVFRAFLQIEDIELKKYLQELANGTSLKITGRIEEAPKIQRNDWHGWDWEGGPQIIVTSKSQIQKRQGD